LLIDNSYNYIRRPTFEKYQVQNPAGLPASWHQAFRRFANSCRIPIYFRTGLCENGDENADSRTYREFLQ